MHQSPEILVQDFLSVAKLAGVDARALVVDVESEAAPHTPPKQLPKGKMAVYVFSYRGKTLKVGKVGPRSQARYTTQHYIPGSAPSTLAASLLKGGGEIGISGLTEANVTEWIKANTERWNFLLDASQGIHVLTLLESFLQCRLQPAFEGFESQRTPNKALQSTPKRLPPFGRA